MPACFRRWTQCLLRTIFLVTLLLSADEISSGVPGFCGSLHGGRQTWRRHLQTLTAFVSPSRSRRVNFTPRNAKNPFEVLELPKTATQDEIRSSYQKLASMYHPDVPDTGDQQRFREICQASGELATEAGMEHWKRLVDMDSQANMPSAEETFEAVFQKALARAVDDSRQRQKACMRALRESVSETVAAEQKCWDQDVKGAGLKKDMLRAKVKQVHKQNGEALLKRIELVQEALQEEEDGKAWTERFPKSQAEALKRREEIGRTWLARIQEVKNAGPLKETNTWIKERLDEFQQLAQRRREKHSERWEKSSKKRLKSLGRSIEAEPSFWKKVYVNAAMKVDESWKGQTEWIATFKSRMQKASMMEVEPLIKYEEEARKATSQELAEHDKAWPQSVEEMRDAISAKQKKWTLHKIDLGQTVLEARLKKKRKKERFWLEKFAGGEYEDLHRAEEDEERRLVKEYWNAICELYGVS